MKKYYTRKEATIMLREAGFPIGKNRIDKDVCEGRGPKPVGRYGTGDLYEADEIMRYGRARAKIKIEPAA